MFDFVPKLVSVYGTAFLGQAYYAQKQVVFLLKDATTYHGSGQLENGIPVPNGTLSWSENTVSWYNNDKNQYSNKNQLNIKNEKYYYVAIG